MFAIPLGSMMAGNPPVRYPSQLTRYVRMEYGDPNPEWLIAEARAAREDTAEGARWVGREKATLQVV